MEAGSPKNDRSGMNGRPEARQPVSVLARRGDFQLGAATILPSLRRVEGPQGQATVEPLVMLVLVTFADSGGAVLTREDLMRSCWSGSVVGDDAITRAVSEVRRVARATGAGFGIENIPRIGYRLTEERLVAPAAAPPGGEAPPAGPPPSTGEPSLAGEPSPTRPPAVAAPVTAVMTRRRWLLTGALAAAAAAGMAVLLWPRRPRLVDPRIATLLEQGQKEVRWEDRDILQQGIHHLQQAIGIDPTIAEAWGLLALGWAYAAEFGIKDAKEECERAVREARKLDRDEPNAIVADALIKRGLESWYQTELRLGEVIRRHPGHTPALAALATQLQSAGYSKESSDLIDRILELDAAAGLTLPGTWTRNAIKSWLLGNDAEAVQQAVYALRQWEDHHYVRRSALFLFAFNGDLDRARVMIDRMPTARDTDLQFVQNWRLVLKALGSGAAEDIAAVAAQIPSGPIHDVHKTMILSQLGLVDQAYEVLLHYSHLEADQVPPEGSGGKSDHNPVWRQFQWVFCPAMRNLRRDQRFLEWSRGVLLDQYWDQRGEEPDEGRRYTGP